MSVRLVIDMNLSPLWVNEFARHGRSAIHWSSIGDPAADDEAIMDWAATNDHVVFTHDLDFGAILARTHASWPSVLQVRGQNVMPYHLGRLVASVINQYESALSIGSLVVIEQRKSRVRVLPL